MKQILLFVLLGLSSITTWAQLAPPEKYTCSLYLAAEDVEAGKGEWTFEVGATGASHGGNGLTFTAGAHEVYVAADGHWLTLGWQKSGTVIANGLFAMSPTDFAENRVAILYNPDGSGNQVAVSCAAVR